MNGEKQRVMFSFLGVIRMLELTDSPHREMISHRSKRSA